MLDFQPTRKRNLKAYEDRKFRIIVAMSLGLVTGAACLFRMVTLEDGGANDFTWHWLGARALLAGQSPYEAVTAGGRYKLIAPYIYPLTTAIAAIPFSAFLSPAFAVALFVGVSTGLLAWGLSKNGFYRFPLFLSVPYLWSLNSGQFSLIVTAGALVSAISWIAPIKPTIGLAAIAYRPSRWALLGSAAFLLLAFAFDPHWVSEWRTALTHRVSDVYWAPITVLGGPLLLLAVFRWRRPEARLLLVLAIVPQMLLFYDQLLLWLLPRNWRESITLTALSWLALCLGNKGLSPNASAHDVVSAYSSPIVLLLFLPSLLMVLCRPNEGEISGWLSTRRRLTNRTSQRGRNT